MQHFQLSGIDPSPLTPLFSLAPAALAQRGIVRTVATHMPGFPCRITLEDAPVGEEVLLLSYAHQPCDSPYRASGPIFIRNAVNQTILPPDEVPPYIAERLISVRAYDAADMIVGAEVCPGAQLGVQLAAVFEDPAVEYIHLHNARYGCYFCLATRSRPA